MGHKYVVVNCFVGMSINKQKKKKKKHEMLLSFGGKCGKDENCSLPARKKKLALKLNIEYKFLISWFRIVDTYFSRDYWNASLAVSKI